MQLSSSVWTAAFVALMLACSAVLAHPLGKDAEATQETETAAAAAENGKESKVYADMLQILQDVENSQAQLQNVLKTTNTDAQQTSDRREDTLQTTGAVADSTAAGNTPAVANLLNMEHIVKALESVASTLSKGSKGLTADASSTDEAVLRNERDSGYGVPQSSYGPNTVAETPNNFINVFSQAAANTVNFATQLLNSLVGVAANILQGTVSTLLSLLNAKGQIVGAVVQSAPPVLASVTRTAGDVLAAKARIFGAVTQSAVNFASQLAQTVTTTFSSLFNGPNAINFNALGRRDHDGSASSGIANLGQTIVSSQLNLLNGILSPFVNGGRSGSSSSSSGSSLNPFAALFGGGGSGSNPLAALFGGGSGTSPLAALFPSLSRSRSSANSNSDSSSSLSSSESSEPNFRITIGSGGSSGIGSSSPINVPTEPDEEIDDKETK